jgi:hypothetical protein
LALVFKVPFVLSLSKDSSAAPSWFDKLTTNEGRVLTQDLSEHEQETFEKQQSVGQDFPAINGIITMPLRTRYLVDITYYLRRIYLEKTYEQEAQIDGGIQLAGDVPGNQH